MTSTSNSNMTFTNNTTLTNNTTSTSNNNMTLTNNRDPSRKKWNIPKKPKYYNSSSISFGLKEEKKTTFLALLQSSGIHHLQSSDMHVFQEIPSMKSRDLPLLSAIQQKPIKFTIHIWQIQIKQYRNAGNPSEPIQINQKRGKNQLLDLKTNFLTYI